MSWLWCATTTCGEEEEEEEWEPVVETSLLAENNTKLHVLSRALYWPRSNGESTRSNRFLAPSWWNFSNTPLLRSTVPWHSVNLRQDFVPKVSHWLSAKKSGEDASRAIFCDDSSIFTQISSIASDLSIPSWMFKFLWWCNHGPQLPPDKCCPTCQSA